MCTWTSKIGTTVPKTSLYMGDPLILGTPIKACSSCLAKPERVALMMMKNICIFRVPHVYQHTPQVRFPTMTP